MPKSKLDAEKGMRRYYPSLEFLEELAASGSRSERYLAGGLAEMVDAPDRARGTLARALGKRSRARSRRSPKSRSGCRRLELIASMKSRAKLGDTPLTTSEIERHLSTFALVPEEPMFVTRFQTLSEFQRRPQWIGNDREAGDFTISAISRRSFRPHRARG